MTDDKVQGTIQSSANLPLVLGPELAIAKTPSSQCPKLKFCDRESEGTLEGVVECAKQRGDSQTHYLVYK